MSEEYDLRYNFFALFYTIVHNCSVNEALDRFEIHNREKPVYMKPLAHSRGEN